MRHRKAEQQGNGLPNFRWALVCLSLPAVSFAQQAPSSPPSTPMPTPVPVTEVLTHVFPFGATPSPLPTMAPFVAADGSPLPTPVPRSRLDPGWDVPKPKPTPLNAAAASDTVPEAKSDDPNVQVLEKKVVYGEKDPFVADKKAELEARRARATAEVEKVEDSVLDEILNNPAFSFLGPFSTTNRVQEAKARLNQMDLEERLLLLIDATKDPAQKAELKRFLMEVRYNVRMDK